MLQITKEQHEFIRQNIRDPYIVICSKSKHGTKGNKMSGKTYFCPESRKYMDLLTKFDEMGGDVNGS